MADYPCKTCTRVKDPEECGKKPAKTGLNGSWRNGLVSTDSTRSIRKRSGAKKMAKLQRTSQRQKAVSKEQCKIRVLAVERMLSYDRRITAAEIQRRLDLQYDIQVSQKTLYSDMYAIDRFIPLDVCGGKNGGYKKLVFKEEEDD